MTIPNYSVGEAVEILHRSLPVVENTTYFDFQNSFFDLSNGEKAEVLTALIKIYEHFGHRVDVLEKHCLICDGNPLG